MTGKKKVVNPGKGKEELGGRKGEGGDARPRGGGGGEIATGHPF